MTKVPFVRCLQWDQVCSELVQQVLYCSSRTTHSSYSATVSPSGQSANAYDNVSKTEGAHQVTEKQVQADVVELKHLGCRFDADILGIGQIVTVVSQK